MIPILLAAAFTACGSERVQVKNLLDNPKLEAPLLGTVETLRTYRAPPWSSRARRRRLERSVVFVDVEVIAFKSEADGDIHAVIREGVGQVMIAEFPNLACTGGSPYQAQMQKARAAFQRLMKKHVQRLRLTGVVFFDKLHGQLGVAPNGIELHPILKVEALP